MLPLNLNSVNYTIPTSEIIQKTKEIRAHKEDVSRPIESVNKQQPEYTANDERSRLLTNNVDDNLEVSFEINETTNQPVINFVDKMTNEVKRSIPSEHEIKLKEQIARMFDLNEYKPGLLINTRA